MDPSHVTASARLSFTFAEFLEEGELKAYSCGNGRFIPGVPNADQRVCFHLQKDSENLHIQIKDDGLLLWLRAIPALCSGLEESVEDDDPWISMHHLLPHYRELRERFAKHNRQQRTFDAVELFVRHFLREGSVLATFGFEYLYEKSLLTELHFHDIQSQERSICEDLDLLDESIGRLEETYPSSLTNVLADLSFQSELQDAIERRDTISVDKLLAMSPYVVDCESLWLAIEFYEDSVFRLLLEHSPQVAWVDSSRHFYHAANVGHIGAVQLLLTHYGDDRAGLSDKIDVALDGAASGGHLEIVKYLVEKKGANVDGKAVQTPLIRARKHDHKPVINYLLRASAESRKDELRCASQNDDFDCLKGLTEVDKDLISIRDKLLRFVTEGGHAEVGDWSSWAGAAYGRFNWIPGKMLYAKTMVESGFLHEEDEVGYYAAVEAIRAQERKALERQLFAKVARSRRKLLGASAGSNATASLKAFAGHVGTCSSVFRAGTRVIRDIAEGYMPSGLLGVVCALQVASAMRSVISDSKIVYSKTAFINDLPRWASLLNPGDQQLLDEIASVLWGTTVPISERGIDFICAQSLEYLQELVDKLVRASRPVDPDSGSFWAPGSYRLSSLRKRHTFENLYDHPGEERLPLWKWQPFTNLDVSEKVHIDPPEPPDQEKQLATLARIAVLMAGAIFGAIILYLCVLQWGLSTIHHPVLYSDAGQDWDSNQIMAQNCVILSRYTANMDLVESGGLISTFDWLSYTTPDSTGPSGTFPVESVQKPGAATPSTSGGDTSVVNSFSTMDAVMDNTPTGCSPSAHKRPEKSPAATTSLSTISPPTTIQTNDESTATGTSVDGAVSCEFPGCHSVFRLGKAGRRGQSSNRQKHMDTFHSRDPVMYKCGTCAKQGPIKWNMNDHEKRCARKRARRREKEKEAET